MADGSAWLLPAPEMMTVTMDDSDSRSVGAAIPRNRPGRSAAAPPPAQPGPGAAFSAFYRQFVPTLVAFLVWQGARPPDATDIAQDTMIKAYQRWSEIHQPQSWTRRVASRALVRRIASVEDFVDDPPEHSSLLPTLTSVEAWEQRHEVLRLLDRLPPRQRQVLAWALDGYTPAEIADELEITPEAVRANLMKARRALAEYLGTTEDER
jgi:RNA polymerase sigma factor (sigma-70 family)